MNNNYALREDVTILDKNGQLQNMELSKSLKIKNKRKGIYESVGTEYDNLILMMSSRLENEIMINIRSIPKKTFYFGWNARKFAEMHKYKINKVNVVFKKLKEKKFIKELNDGQFMINPRIYIPFGCSNLIEEAYIKWENNL